MSEITVKDIRPALKECGKSMADLSRSTGIGYQKMSGALNGYWGLSEDNLYTVWVIISKWRAELSGKAV